MNQLLGRSEGEKTTKSAAKADDLLGKGQIRQNVVFEEKARSLCIDAARSAVKTCQKCLIAGQFLIEWKAATKHGDFLGLLVNTVPELHPRTCQRWMLAAERVSEALKLPNYMEAENGAGRVSLSDVLLDESAELNFEVRKLWFEFTAEKTLKDCLRSILIEGEDEIAMERALNGKLLGGGQGDRKDWALFFGRKLLHLDTFIKHWDTMSEKQKGEIERLVEAMFSGGEAAVRRSSEGGKASVHQFGLWPERLSKLAAEALRERLKNRE